MTTPAIQVRQASFSYATGAAVLRSVDLTLMPGEFMALIGPNGSGKTTLAKLLVGLLRPESGQISIDGQALEQLPVSERARLVGFVFQNPDHQLFSATVGQELGLGPRNLELSDEQTQLRIEQAAAEFGLRDMLEQRVGALSYGQRKTLSLASVATLRPHIWILDEPTSGLHWRAAQALLDWVAERTRAGHSALLITHDMRLVAEYAGRAALMQNGRIVAGGAPYQLFGEAELLSQADLQPPPIVRLAHQLGMPPEVVTVGAACQAYGERRG